MFRSIFLSVSAIALYCASNTADANFACPDDHALKLLEIARSSARNAAFTEPEATYTYVIRNSTREMDRPALIIACRGLARFLFEEGQACGGLSHCPALPNEEIASLKGRFPILMACPSRSIHRDESLPIARMAVVPTTEMRSGTLTGWVSFSLTISSTGVVEEARVLESTDSALVEPSTAAVLQYIYKPAVDADRQPIIMYGVEATVRSSYLDLARAAGCHGIGTAETRH